MFNYLKIIFAAICAAEVPLVALYISYLNNRKPYKVKKMICSTLFVLAGVIAALTLDKPQTYSVFLIVGLVLSWLGDLFLAFSLRGTPFVLGLGSFLLGHVAYVFAFSAGISQLTGTIAPAWYEFVVVAAVIAASLIVKKKCNIVLKEMALPVLFYALTISVMLARACHLGFAYSAVGVTASDMFCLMMIFGAAMFVTSDSVLVFIIFKNKGNNKTETANLVTYYLAQVIFATSIFFIG